MTMVLCLIMTFIVRQSTVHYGLVEHFVFSAVIFVLVLVIFFFLDLRVYTFHMEPIMKDYLKEHPEISEEEAINNEEIFAELGRILKEKDEWIRFGSIIELHSLIIL